MVEGGKKLNELRVSDLKEELEKRKMDTIGAKATLVERLEKALKQEGLDPTKYVFKPNNKPVPKGKEANVKNELMEVKIKEEPIDEEYIENGENEAQHNDDDDDEVDQVGTVDDECVIIEDEEQYDNEIEHDENDEQHDDNDEEHDENADNEHNAEDDEDNVETNNHYGEESLNLTIGEDEQLLLHEAADEKEKPAEVNTSQKEKSSNKENKSEKSHRDDKKSTKDEDANKSRKKDDKTSSDKKDNSEHKSSTKSTQKDDKEKSNNTSTNNAVSNSTKTSKTSTPSRNLWVSGLSSLTRASDLKTIFSTYGKVIGAKVVTNTRTPGSRCYGYVTMSSSSDASRCIDHLHRTELHGRIISVERTKNEIGSNSTNTNKDAAKSHHSSRADSKKKDDDKKSRSSKETGTKANDDKRRRDDAKKDDKDKDKDKSKDKKDDKDTKHDRTVDRKRSREPARSKDNDKDFRQREKEHLREIKRHREILSYHKIREERERQRLRQKERELREEERRRRELRDRHRQEELRLAEERRKLLQERDRLERERSELMRLERERQKLEREKIELERLEVKRQQMKMLQAREDPIKRHSKHTTDDRYADVSDRKRTTTTESRLEAPPPPRFDASLVSRSYDKKRDDYTSSSTSKRIDYNKRDDYASTGSKRSAIDDYTTVPVKRTSDDYTKRGDYLSSAKPAREEYKREVEIRHIPSSGTTNAFHSKSSSNRYGGDTERTNYRRTGGIEDIRSSSNNVWPSTGHISSGTSLSTGLHNSNWQKNMHTDDNTWRPAQATQDRYDRTFNERGGYGGSGAMYGNSGRTGQDRYGPMSRY